MNVLLLIGLIAIEICTCVLLFSENSEKKVWFRNRFVGSVIELLLFLIFLVFPGVDLGFRFKGIFFLLITKVIISGIIALCRRKAKGNKNKISAVISTILVSLLFIGASLPSFIFADYKGIETSGKYEVANSNGIIIDESRLEEFEEDGSYRELPVHVYYPANAISKESFPIVFFSHGSFGYYESNHSTYNELASNGYVVVSMDHPYHAFYCKDTSGKVITVDTGFINDVMGINSENVDEEEILKLSSVWFDLRKKDMNFAIDTIKKSAKESDFGEEWYFENQQEKDGFKKALSMVDTNKIGLMGHSLGGATAEILGRTRDDIMAVVDLDGTMLGEQLGLKDCEPYEFEGKIYTKKYVINEEAYTTPILNIDNEEHHNSRIEARKIAMPYANNIVMDNAIMGYDTYFANTGHMNFTDLPLFSPILAKALGTGSVDAEKCIESMNGLILGFFDYTLKDYGSFNVKDCYAD